MNKLPAINNYYDFNDLLRYIQSTTECTAEELELEVLGEIDGPMWDESYLINLYQDPDQFKDNPKLDRILKILTSVLLSKDDEIINIYKPLL